jgi:hypothetical protein
MSIKRKTKRKTKRKRGGGYSSSKKNTKNIIQHGGFIKGEYVEFKHEGKKITGKITKIDLNFNRVFIHANRRKYSVPISKITPESDATWLERYDKDLAKTKIKQSIPERSSSKVKLEDLENESYLWMKKNMKKKKKKKKTIKAKSTSTDDFRENLLSRLEECDETNNELVAENEELKKQIEELKQKLEEIKIAPGSVLYGNPLMGEKDDSSPLSDDV